jgi:hypothetical protein
MEQTYARATGRFVKKPNAKELMPVMTAVAVMISLLISTGMSTMIRQVFRDIPIKHEL